MNETTVRINFRYVSLVLLAVILGMLGLWRPWQGTGSQTISMTGEASVKATPDEFSFSPTYQQSASTSVDAISAVSKTGNAVVAKLKELGIEEKAIKTSVNSTPDYSKPYIGIPERDPGTTPGGYLATYSLTVIVNDKDLAQKTLDYLVTTSPLYGVSPQSTFRAETRAQLEAEARSKAVADAKSKAAQTAEELEVRVGRVVSVSEPSWGGVIPMTATGSREIALDTAAPTTPVLLTGEETVTYSVVVVFRLR